ncbi:MAG: anaerobic glycerol-3-phosphate dehydrogenase subunit GlpB [Candidatus Freyarchaeota archaeon]
MLEAEVLVIGGGIAGLVAAARAADEGLEVLVVDKGSGATYQSAGVVDVMAYPPSQGLFLNPLKGVEVTVKTAPTHPYAIIGRGNEEESVRRVKEAVEYFIDLTSSGIRLEGDIERNVILMNTIGSFKVTCLAPHTIFNGKVDDLSDASLLIAGFRGLLGFNPAFCASGAEYIASKFNVNLKEAMYTWLSHPRLRKFNLTFIELARMMDDDEFRKELGEALRKAVAEREATHIALPTLGFESPEENMKVIEEEAGAKVFELISPPPSIPGQRMVKILEECVRKRKVRVIRGYKAAGFREENMRVKEIILESGEKKIPVRVGACILATGKFIGGGLTEEEDMVKEAVFGLPVYDGRGQPLDERKIPKLLVRDPFSQQPLIACGVKVNPQMKPLTLRGKPYENLFAAGSIISGYDYVKERSGIGVAAATGYFAGLNAAYCLKR